VHAELLLAPSNPLENQSERGAQLCMSRAGARLAAAPAARRRMERERDAEVEVCLRVADDVIVMLHLLRPRARVTALARMFWQRLSQSKCLAAVVAERMPLQRSPQSGCSGWPFAAACGAQTPDRAVSALARAARRACEACLYIT